MLKSAAAGESIEIPVGSGGSFVSMDDMSQALGLCLNNPKAFGLTFNVATVYVRWEEFAEMVAEVTGNRCEIKRVPREEWKGSAFLADPWELDITNAKEILGYHPTEAAKARKDLKEVIAKRWASMQEN